MAYVYTRSSMRCIGAQKDLTASEVTFSAYWRVSWGRLAAHITQTLSPFLVQRIATLL